MDWTLLWGAWSIKFSPLINKFSIWYLMIRSHSSKPCSFKRTQTISWWCSSKTGWSQTKQRKPFWEITMGSTLSSTDCSKTQTKSPDRITRTKNQRVKDLLTRCAAVTKVISIRMKMFRTMLNWRELRKSWDAEGWARHSMMTLKSPLSWWSNQESTWTPAISWITQRHFGPSQ